MSFMCNSFLVMSAIIGIVAVYMAPCLTSLDRSSGKKKRDKRGKRTDLNSSEDSDYWKLIVFGEASINSSVDSCDAQHHFATSSKLHVHDFGLDDSAMYDNSSPMNSGQSHNDDKDHSMKSFPGVKNSNSSSGRFTFQFPPNNEKKILLDQMKQSTVNQREESQSQPNYCEDRKNNSELRVSLTKSVKPFLKKLKVNVTSSWKKNFCKKNQFPYIKLRRRSGGSSRDDIDSNNNDPNNGH